MKNHADNSNRFRDI